jgi:branched-chain amino acid transport system substrate-binding protein
MKRYWKFLIIVLIAAFVLAACGGAEDPTPTIEPEATQAEEPVEEPTEEVMEEPTEEVMEEPTEEVMEEPTEEPAAEEPTEEPAEEPTEEVMMGDCSEDLTGETITIYQQAGLTGPLSQILGDGFINGSRDAITQINEEGGICGAELVIRTEDTQYDPAQELEIYEQFREEDPPPLFVLTYGSGATIILKDRVIEDQIPNIAAGLDGTSFYVPRDGWTVGVAPIYSDQFAGFLQWASDNWADIKPAEAGDDIVVGVVGWDNAFGSGATTPEALAFAESLGVTVLDLETQPIDPTADVTGQVQNLLLSGANLIWVQSLSFGPAQVIGTIRALDFWDQVVVGGVNWSMNQDVVNILGENAQLMDGYYGVFPSLYWNDEEAEGVQSALASFEAGGYPETDKGVSYLLSYGTIFALRDIILHAIETVGFENLSGATFFDAMKEMGTISASGLFNLNVEGQDRAPREAQIRQAQFVDGTIEFVVVEDFFELPDTRPAAE